ncbi:DNA-3-methyladenine glycosylase [Candidatus Bathyarchaeota archaeon]|nr:DNA-3-methyladenine glycosylase [Candidatus Bathyarchaeota archaeon]
MKEYEEQTILNQNFYSRDTALVAEELLGKLLIRRLGEKEVGGFIVETEAYYGEKDPASRAYNGKKNYNEVMYGASGHLFIYNVHQYWMLNFIAHKPGGIGGVLIRAIEPTIGLDVMKKNRPVSDIVNLTSGPGKLTLALDVDKSLNGIPGTEKDNLIVVKNNEMEFEVGRSHRIGVTRDLNRELRFYVKGNKFVSVRPR